MRTLLIANRGEIVCRVARTARRMGLRTVAVASQADLDAPHAAACDALVPIGGERPADSYLHVGKLLDAARAAGADAVHPGYGFLSENAGFAQAVLGAGLAWVGPPPAAMAAMGDKARARRHMAAAGVPVLPGYDGPAQDLATLQREARELGFPLMVKAAAGGGGRGMRLVHEAAALEAALQAAHSEAQAAFGDGRLLLERALLAPRHVEVQVFADAHGTVLHLGERDCSVQRRHQKLVEEAPSPAVDAGLRRRVGEAAVRVAREIGYVGAGTVEFLLDEDGRFWFMEMNTRLQVEHPVTEALTGLDLVEWQLRVAMGEALPWTQQDLLERYERGGHAVEVRLCAEDPAQDFLPCSGSVRRWSPPAGLRCDHALRDGLQVGPFYDSMLGKLIAHAGSREAALRQLADGLDRTICLGLPTNRGFLARVLRHQAFQAGQATTQFIAQHFADDATRREEAATALQALSAAALALLPERALPALWAGWTPGGRVDCSVPMDCDGALASWRLTGTPEALLARCGEAQHRLEGLALHEGSVVGARVDGRPLQAVFAADGARRWWHAEGTQWHTEDRRLATAARQHAQAAGAVAAPMHGRVTQVLAQPGHAVQAGALLLVMEAMKMEHQLTAPVAGTVQQVHARVGEQVAARKLLVEIGP
ncbi:MAG: biotin carboxylase N-terminal domain-containing protein [Pseudomonadota bacterium]